jgi:hypothetical protein
MTNPLARLPAVGVLLLLASASAGASRGRPPVALTASPAQVQISGAGRALVRVTNSGVDPVVVDVARAGFALDLRGRPRIVAARKSRRSAARWLSVRPRALGLPPRSTRSVKIESAPPSHAEPGDHDALVLLTTRRRVKGRVAVRMRVGVLVVVRIPGLVRHRLALRRVRVVGDGRPWTLGLMVANRGNVTESFSRARTVVTLYRAGRRIARLTTAPRHLRPGTTGVLQFRCWRRPHGSVRARVEVTSQSGAAVRRTLRLRL